MATLKVEALPREFYFNGTRIPDPAPQMTAEEIRDLLTPTYPEIATATLTGPEDTGNRAPLLLQPRHRLEGVSRGTARNDERGAGCFVHGQSRRGSSRCQPDPGEASPMQGIMRPIERQSQRPLNAMPGQTGLCCRRHQNCFRHWRNDVGARIQPGTAVPCWRSRRLHPRNQPGTALPVVRRAGARGTGQRRNLEAGWRQRNPIRTNRNGVVESATSATSYLRAMSSITCWSATRWSGTARTHNLAREGLPS